MDVDPGATCFEPGRLVASVQAWLGRELVRRDVHVHVQGDAQRATSASFRIERGGKVRERRFGALPAGCEDAMAVVGLAVAMAIDADVMKAFVEPPPPAAPLRPSSLAVQAAVGLESYRAPRWGASSATSSRSRAG